MEYTNEMGLVSKPLLREVSDAIRKKTGSNESIKVKEFPEKILNISSSILRYKDTPTVTVKGLIPENFLRLVNASLGAPISIYSTTSDYWNNNSFTKSISSINGGLVIAIVAIRGTFSTVSEGWDLIYTSEKTPIDFSENTAEISKGIKQHILIFTKKATSNSTSITVTTTGTAWIRVNLFSLRYYQKVKVTGEIGGAANLNGTEEIELPSGNTLVTYTSTYAVSSTISMSPNCESLVQTNSRLATGFYSKQGKIKITNSQTVSGTGYLVVFIKIKE